MSTHTPGPWTTEPNGGDDSDVRRLYICADKGAMTTVAEAYSGVEHGDPEANARLIAAAPDLLALVKRFTAALGNDETLQGGERVGLTDRSRIDGPALNAALIEAKAAIAEAEGVS